MNTIYKQKLDKYYRHDKIDWIDGEVYHNITNLEYRRAINNKYNNGLILKKRKLISLK